VKLKRFGSITALSLLVLAVPWAAVDAQSSPPAPVPFTAQISASPKPKPDAGAIRDQLGKLDARGQAIVVGGSMESAQTNSAAIAKL
jgi:hypothetical protein